MSILVTGAYGQLGRELCAQIGAEALPTDFDTLDLSDGSAVRTALARWRPQAVINCAAYTQVDLAEKEPDRCRAVNATAVRSLAQACAELDCPLVQISTDYVYAGNPRPAQPFRETDRPMPLGVYAITKYEGEAAAAGWQKHVIVRTCGLYARPSHAEAKNFVKTMLGLGASGKTLRVVNDQHCTPTYVPHLARAVRFLAGLDGVQPAWGVYHVVNRGATTWCQFAREIFRQAGMAVEVEPITTAEYAAPAPRPAYSVLDTAAYHALGGPAMPDWQAGLAEYLDEMRHGDSSR
jgi:dTDP-4-dehydrorhamnose reductase